jgi:hypothetical protein
VGTPGARIYSGSGRFRWTLPGGNFTVLGLFANLIVVQRAAASGVAIGFGDDVRLARH